MKKTGGILPECFASIRSLAALSQGKSFVGIEATQHYFDVACRRLTDSVDAE